MLDLIITSYQLTINVSSYLKEYTQYPVDYTYNIGKKIEGDGVGEKKPRIAYEIKELMDCAGRGE